MAPATDAQKACMKAYMAKIQGTPQGDRIHRLQNEAKRKYFNNRYHTDPEFKEKHTQYMRARYQAKKLAKLQNVEILVE